MKLWNIQTVEYDSAAQKNEVLTRATTWVVLKNTAPRERRWSKPHILLYDPTDKQCLEQANLQT